MMRSATGVALLSALAALLGACAPDKVPKVESNAVPVKYKDEVITTLRVLFDKNETASVTHAMITDPVLRPVGNEQHYAVCVRYTAHGTAFNLSAEAERIGYFYGGHLNQLVPADNGECAKAAYKPFPELDQVCLGRGCK
ncbi:MAG TPA: hypothetical protein VFA57_02895 [Pseudolabrys sp.]|jgi:hypothetical protein|nr:hypothetical protein [Pseudolabrys sp.]